MLKRISVFSIALLIAIVSGGCKPAKPLNLAEKIVGLGESLMFEQVVAELQTHSWKTEKDPLLLMYYCEALAETGRPLPSNMTSPDVPLHVRLFAEGYHKILNGNFQESEQIFATIVEQKSHMSWGIIGFLEYGLRTKNISLLKASLELIKQNHKDVFSSLPDWVIPTYDAYYQYFSGNFDETERIIESFERRMDQMAFFDLKMNLLVRDNKLDEAGRLIASMPQKYQNAAVLKSRLVKIKYGPEKWIDYLRKTRQSYPQFWLIEEDYGNALIQNGDTKKGADVLRALANKRRHDYVLQLNLIEELLFERNFKQTENILLNELKNAGPFLYDYNIVFASASDDIGDDKKADQYLATAQSLFPESLEVMELRYERLLRGKRYGECRELMSRMIRLAPNDVHLLIKKMELDFFDQNWNAILAGTKKLTASPRYISEDQWLRIKSLEAISLAHTGDMDSANKVLAQMKESKAKTLALTHIEKIKSQKQIR